MAVDATSYFIQYRAMYDPKPISDDGEFIIYRFDPDPVDPENGKIEHDIFMGHFTPDGTEATFDIPSSRRAKFFKALKAAYGLDVTKLLVVRDAIHYDEHKMSRFWVRFPEGSFPPHSALMLKMTLEF